MDDGLLTYSNRTNINVIPKKAFENLLSETFEIISTNISKSLGPLGSSATILDGMIPEATKDGFAILKNYRFTNRYKQMIYNLIQAPCTKLNNTVGDGTTTAIVLTNYLFQFYKNKKNILETLFRLPKHFINTWDSIIDRIIDQLGEYAKPITNDNIYNIAYVSSNGNKEVTETIAKIYSECSSPYIKEKDSPTNKTYVEQIVGYEFPVNLIDDAFVRNEDLSVEEQDFYTLIFDHKIETDVCNNFIFPITNVFRALGKKLLIMAPYYDKYLTDTYLKSYLNHEYQKYKSFNTIFGQYDFTKLAKDQLTDFAVVLKSRVIDQKLMKTILEKFNGNPDLFVEMTKDPDSEFYNLFGKVKKANLSCISGSTFEPEDLSDYEPYNSLKALVKNQLTETIKTIEVERQSYAMKIYDIESRLNRLEMKNYIYYIGANSALQKNILWDQVDDVIKCTRSAVKNGTLPGSQLSVIKAISKIMSDILKEKDDDVSKLTDQDTLELVILEIIQDAVVSTYSKVLTGPDGMGIIKLIPDWFKYHAKVTPEMTEEQIKEANRIEQEKLQELEKEKRLEIIRESINKNSVFDLETLEYNSKIITSAETDKMVLLAASELVKILISGSQCVYLDSNLNSSEVKPINQL